MKITTIGLDLAKSIFQVHGVDATGQVVIRKSLRRSQMLPFFAKLPSCLIGIEACGTSHHWARELIKLGHEVRLMPPAYVKPYVKRGKTDAADAEAVCEAVTRPTMRFVHVKSPEQQAALSMHRTRDLLVKQRTQLINMIRGLLAEFGIDIPKGLERALLMARQIVEGKAPDVPIEAAKIVGTLSQNALDTQLSRRGRGALLSSTQLVDGPGIRSHTLWLSECEKAAYLDFLSKSRRPPVTLDETGTLYTDGPAQSPGPSLPETLNPSRRLDRDGEQVITKVVAGTHVEHGFNYDTLIAQVRISKCCDYVSFQRHAIFAGMTSSQPVGARRLSQWRVLAAHKACTDDRAGTCLLPTIYRHRINLTPGWSPSINSTPAASSARRTAAKLLIEGTRRPFSKSRMVLSLRFDRAANSA